jgi:hypothetical protein
MKDNFKSWEDVGSMGRNLYRLLILQETYAPRRPENPLDKDMSTVRSSSNMPLRTTPVGFGQLSHATSHSFMSMAENAQYLSGWTLTPTKILDELKAFLLAEQQAQEWDVLSEKEWGDMENVIATQALMMDAAISHRLQQTKDRQPHTKRTRLREGSRSGRRGQVAGPRSRVGVRTRPENDGCWYSAADVSVWQSCSV